jgi:hypothetical protein
MYYRVAIQVDPLPTWQWRSTVLFRKITCGCSPPAHVRACTSS